MTSDPILPIFSLGVLTTTQWPDSVYDVFAWFRCCPAISGIRVPLEVFDRWDSELATTARFTPGMDDRRSWVLTYRGDRFIIHDKSHWYNGYRAIRRALPRFVEAEPSERNHRFALGAKFLRPFGFSA